MADDTGIVPQGLSSAPVLSRHLNYYHNEFQELSLSRPYTSGQPLPITIAAIKAHCDFFRLDEYESYELHEYVRLFDHNWLSIKAKKAEEKTKSLPST